MRLYHVLLVTSVALLTRSLTAAETKTSTLTLPDAFLSDSTPEGRDGDGRERSLRATILSEEKDQNAEERGGWTSSLTAKISKKIPMGVKISWWQEIGKSNSYVKKHLGLEGLSGPALTGHKNFPRFVKYVDTAEKHKLAEKARGGFATYDIWVDMGLGSVTRLSELKQPQYKEAFRIYKRYVLAFDDNMFSTMGSGYYLPKFVSEKATPLEMKARAQIWAEVGRSQDYVKMILGLENKTGSRLTSSAYYKYYEHYIEVLKKPTA